MAKIYIDPGHGGSDPGATGNGLREKDVVLKIARYTRDYLQNNYSGVSVRMSRTDDSFPSLSDRSNDANSWGADIFVSIHANAFNGSAHGYEDFIFNGNVSSNTRKLQDSLHDAIAPLFRNNRGKKQANFAVLRQTNMPAVLTENGFIDNAQDAVFLKKDSNLKKIAEAHAKGIAAYLGLSGGTSGSGNAKPPSKSKGANLTVDGKWGNATTEALQQALDTVEDGIISNQRRNAVTEAKYGNTVRFSSSGNSMVIRALQKVVGATEDGLNGPQTVRQLQRYLGTVQDGKLSRPSMVVEEMQRRLNAGTFV